MSSISDSSSSSDDDIMDTRFSEMMSNVPLLLPNIYSGKKIKKRKRRLLKNHPQKSVKFKILKP